VERAAKQELVTELNGVFKTTNTVVVAHYSGLTVAQMQTLRKQAKQAGASVKVAKNRLAKIALEGTDAASIGPLLKGPTVIAYSKDPVAASKVTVDFAKGNEKFVIRTASRRSRPCRRSTSFGPRSSASFRRRRRRSLR
jgi:large subunit ribosomal protein L10